MMGFEGKRKKPSREDGAVENFKRMRVSSPLQSPEAGVKSFTISTRQEDQRPSSALFAHVGQTEMESVYENHYFDHSNQSRVIDIPSPFASSTPLTAGQDWDHSYSINQQLGFLVQQRRKEREEEESRKNLLKYREINNLLASSRQGKLG
jgi:hypothetical protein